MLLLFSKKDNSLSLHKGRDFVNARTESCYSDIYLTQYKLSWSKTYELFDLFELT